MIKKHQKDFRCCWLNPDSFLVLISLNINFSTCLALSFNQKLPCCTTTLFLAIQTNRAIWWNEFLLKRSLCFPLKNDLKGLEWQKKFAIRKRYCTYKQLTYCYFLLIRKFFPRLRSLQTLRRLDLTQLVVRLPSISVICTSNPAICKFYLLSTVWNLCWKDENK